MMKHSKFFHGYFGLEKETVRILPDGHLSTTQHSTLIEEENMYITRDFAEAQIEMITPAQTSVAQAFDFLVNIERVTHSLLQDELLWPMSTPPVLPANDDILEAQYVEDPEKKEYREYLGRKYGKRRAIISGIHFNASMSDDFIQDLYEEASSNLSYPDFKDALYLKVLKYFLKDKWLYVLLFGASPSFDLSFKSPELDLKDHYVSLRNSTEGYRNLVEQKINFADKKSFDQSLKQMIQDKEIRKASEYYAIAKLKPIEEHHHYEYIELRFSDLNPLSIHGVFKKDLELMHLMMLYYAMQEDFDFDIQSQQLSQGKMDAASVWSPAHQDDTMLIDGKDILDQVQIFYKGTEHAPYDVDSLLEEVQNRLKDPSKHYWSQIESQIQEKGYIEYGTEVAKSQHQYYIDSRFDWSGGRSLELSTKILLQKSLEEGYLFEVLDVEENFISITKSQTNHTEYVKQATKTSLDHYANVLMMENKQITKNILSTHHISVPQGYKIASVEEGMRLYHNHELPNHLVVKPNNTNFGLGITIFTDSYSEIELQTALEFAFNEDQTVLLETFAAGKEYRFLVIDQEVVGVLHRQGAHVIGDNKHTVQELINQKNQHPYRSKGYQTPLELIEVDHVVLDLLAKQQLGLESVVAKDQVVILRENSNISTGGDSVDVTDMVHPCYIGVAKDAAKAMGAAITGIDMMIEDLENQASYSIIEMNFNPAIHIHTFPLVGKGKDVSKSILDALFKAKTEKNVVEQTLNPAYHISGMVIYLIALIVYLMGMNQIINNKPTSLPVAPALLVISVTWSSLMALKYKKIQKKWALILSILLALGAILILSGMI